MVAGHNRHRLEKRITAALLSGAANPRELVFLHKIAMRLDEYGENTFLSDKQAKWLSEILCHLCPAEAEATTSSPPVAEAASEDRLEVRKAGISLPAQTNEAPSSDCPSQPASPSVRSDAYADVPQALLHECFGTAKARERHCFLIQKYGRILWIEKLLRGDFDLNHPAGRPFVSD